MKRIHKRKGFTLVELIVVIMIILILASVLVPNVLKYVSKAARANCVETRHSLTTELMAELIMENQIPEAEGEIQIPDTLKKYKCPSGGTYTAKCENGIISISCDVHDEGDGAGDKSGYKPVTVADSAKDYQDPLNAVLKTLYDSVVMEKLNRDNKHISWVLFNNGRIDKIYYYGSETDRMGHNQVTLTDEEKKELDNKISDALKNAGNYKMRGWGATRVFFDWNGNIVSNSQADKIGGQSAPATIAFSKDGKNQELTFKDNNIGWEK